MNSVKEKNGHIPVLKIREYIVQFTFDVVPVNANISSQIFLIS